MITLHFKVPIYDVQVKLVQLEKGDTLKEIHRALSWCKVELEESKDIEQALNSGCKDGGDTWRNFNLRKFIISFYPFETKLARIEVYSHEKRHLEDRIMEYASVNDIESAGLLAGFLSCKFYQFWLQVKSNQQTSNTK